MPFCWVLPSLAADNITRGEEPSRRLTVRKLAVRQREVIMASNKPVEHKSSEPAQSKDQTHKPARHIEETARLASSVEPDKDPEKVRRAKN